MFTSRTHMAVTYFHSEGRAERDGLAVQH